MEHRVRGLKNRQRGPSGLNDVESKMDQAYDRHLDQKASMAEALIYVMDKIRGLIWILIVLQVVGFSSLIFLIYNKLL